MSDTPQFLFPQNEGTPSIAVYLTYFLSVLLFYHPQLAQWEHLATVAATPAAVKMALAIQ